MSLDTVNNKTPLYLQVQDALLDEISQGVYKPGERFPTESELMKKYGVSRITIRNALDALEKKNYIVRFRGKGSFVGQKKITRPISKVLSFSEICQEMGLVPGAKTLKCQLEDATEDDLLQLDLPPASKVLVVERIRFADDIPVSFEISRFNEKYDFLLFEDLNSRSMYSLIEEKTGLTFATSQKTIELTHASYEVSKYLQIPINSPLMQIASVVSTTNGEKAHISLQLVRGDKFKLIV